MNEEEILKECNQLFVTMVNCHIDGKPMADLLALYEQEKEKNEKLSFLVNCYTNEYFIEKSEVDENYISKEKIKKFIEEELPGEEICKSCETYDVNGISLKKRLEKLLEV